MLVDVPMADVASSASRRKSHSYKMLLVGVVLIGANLRAPITSVGPVLPDIQASLAMDSVTAGALNSLPLLIFALLSLLAPAIGGKFGFERTLAAALAAIAIGTVTRSLDLSGAIWIGTIILSVGIAFGNVLLPGLVKRDAGSNAATLIAFYAAAMAATAGISAGLAVPISRLPSSDWRWSLGVWAGFALIALLTWLPQTGKGNPVVVRSSGSPVASRSPWTHSIGWQVSLFFACHSLVFYSLVDWFAVYALSEGISAATAGAYLLVYQIVAVATNLACAPIILRSRDQRALGFMCGVFLVVAALGLYLAPAAAVVWIISGGLGAGLSMTTSLSLFGLRTKDHTDASRLSGMAQFVGYMGAAAGPLLFGWLHEVSGGWSASLVLLVVSSLLVTVFATLAGRSQTID